MGRRLLASSTILTFELSNTHFAQFEDQVCSQENIVKGGKGRKRGVEVGRREGGEEERKGGGEEGRGEGGEEEAQDNSREEK